MRFAVSTRWNTRRHRDGGALIEEIRSAGFDAIELGFDLTRDLVPGIEAAVSAGDIRVVSVHNYCPVPMGAARGHPELYTLADPDPRIRARAVRHTAETVRFAAGMGARIVVVHAGYVRLWRGTPRLYRLWAGDGVESRAFARARERLDRARERKAPRSLDWIRVGLEALLPVLEETGVRIGLENLPFWEAVPSETETASLVSEFGADRIGYWHDVGHGHLREGLGFTQHARLLERLRGVTLGLHVHDARMPNEDHLLPFEGEVDFFALAPVVPPPPAPLVIEPRRDASAEALREQCRRLEALFAGGAG